MWAQRQNGVGIFGVWSLIKPCGCVPIKRGEVKVLPEKLGRLLPPTQRRHIITIDPMNRVSYGKKKWRLEERVEWRYACALLVLAKLSHSISFFAMVLLGRKLLEAIFSQRMRW